MYKYFGDDISPEEFKEMLDFLFTIEEVQNYVTKEKEKCFQRNNPPVVISRNENSEENTFENENAKNENLTNENDVIEIPDNCKNDFIKAMKIGYYKEFYKQGLITAEQLELLIAMKDKSINSAA